MQCSVFTGKVLGIPCGRETQKRHYWGSKGARGSVDGEEDGRERDQH